MRTIQEKLRIILAAALLAGSVGLYAEGYNNDRFDRYDGYKNKQYCDYKKDRKQDCYGKKNYKHGDKFRSHHRGDSSRFIIGAVYALNLSDEQKTSIDKFLTEYQDNRNKRFEAFTKDGFNKEAYIKARTKSKEDMIKAKADLIEKIYGVLTKAQKAELKEEIDDFNKVRQYDKYSNGRR